MAAAEEGVKMDWRALWRTGDLARFCFVSLGILLHATNETMIATILPSMVREISGVQLIGWSVAIYELGSICAGAAAGRLVSYMPLRTNMSGAAALYALGALICGLSPDMNWFLAGRLIEGLGGGALVALAFVSVERLFPRAIWPQLFAIMSAVWGVSAFAGPLLGALISEAFSWRWAFGAFSAAGLAMAAVSFVVLRGSAATLRAGVTPPPFPYIALAVLAASVMLIAYAGVEIGLVRSTVMLTLGMAGLVAFVVIDAAKPGSRLFPSRLFDWRTPIGVGMTMIASFSIATCSFPIYGPLLLTALHGTSVMTAGYIMAAESIGWSVLSILIANAPPRLERPIILTGASMVAAGIAGFAYAVPSGSLPLVLVCAVLQGGGFGMAWPFVTRMIVGAAAPAETTIASSAVPTMQRIGYAVGAATTGIIANAAGFAGGLDRQAAENVASLLFVTFIPFALVGLAAAARISRR